jgi:hypothetical protein
MMVHFHKEDDARILIQLVKEFKIKAVANHCLDVHRQEIFAALKSNSIPIIYGPMDSFSNKDELRHNNWRNAELLLKSSKVFSHERSPSNSPKKHVLYSKASNAIWIIQASCNI